MNSKVSVAMATYNGEKYIKEQIESILKNLRKDDELVISDDGSTDMTIDIITRMRDKRIKLISGPNKGIKQNFANAINNCSGDYIFLSDQDDVWLDNKVSIVIEKFQSNPDVLLIQHDAIVIDSNNHILFNSFSSRRNVKTGIIRNILKNSYHGCCICFKKELKEYILPIPNFIYLHDQWIGLIAEIKGKTLFINDILIKYRRHFNNNSSFKHLPMTQMIKNRIQIIRAILKFYFFAR